MCRQMLVVLVVDHLLVYFSRPSWKHFRYGELGFQNALLRTLSSLLHLHMNSCWLSLPSISLMLGCQLYCCIQWAPHSFTTKSKCKCVSSKGKGAVTVSLHGHLYRREGRVEGRNERRKEQGAYWRILEGFGAPEGLQHALISHSTQVPFAFRSC